MPQSGAKRHTPSQQKLKVLGFFAYFFSRLQYFFLKF